MNGRVARMVDRANAALVAWRVGGRQPTVDADAIRYFVSQLPGQALEDTSLSFRDLRRVTGRGPLERWAREGSDWTADRLSRRDENESALIVLHGWLATRSHIAVHRNLARPIIHDAVEVWTPRLPVHAERTPDGTVSGQLFLSADPIQTTRAICAAVAETRALVRWLRRNGRRRIGLWGTSLGGWVAALVATCDVELDALVLWAPVVDPVDTLNTSPLARDIRGALHRAGVSDELEREAFAPFAPVHREPRLVPDRVLVMAGDFDNVLRGEALAEFERRWRVRARRLPHGHITLMWSRRARRETIGFLRTHLAE